MTFHFRNPPRMSIPPSSRWTGVCRIDSKIEIWFLDLRKALPYFYFPVFCDLVQDNPIPRYELPEQEGQLENSPHLVKGWGQKFFWSAKSKTLVVQLLHTFEYSNGLEMEQVFLSGDQFTVTNILTKQDVLFLPNQEFKEVFPEMHPDRSRP